MSVKSEAENKKMSDPGFADLMLGWYDRHARELPWRVGPHLDLQPDPYRVWLSEIMLQQTTVVVVREYYANFTSRWPTLPDLANAKDDDVMAQWAGLGYYARARNLLKCARLVRDDFGGVFPRDHTTLLTLPGIGPYTAAAISAIAYDRPQTVVDGNVERVMARFFAVRDTLDVAKTTLRAHAARLTPNARPGDYAQAVMDLGATICTPKKPSCTACPVAGGCQGLNAGIAAELPRRKPRKPKPTRFGTVYLARRSDGAWLLERRPQKGLLGGMLGWPGSDWCIEPKDAPPIDAHWHDPGQEVKHTFTHFHLRLSLRLTHVPLAARPDTGQFVDAELFSRSDLPSVMRKALDIALQSNAGIEPGSPPQYKAQEPKGVA